MRLGSPQGGMRAGKAASSNWGLDGTHTHTHHHRHHHHIHIHIHTPHSPRAHLPPLPLPRAAAPGAAASVGSPGRGRCPGWWRCWLPGWAAARRASSSRGALQRWRGEHGWGLELMRAGAGQASTRQGALVNRCTMPLPTPYEQSSWSCRRRAAEAPSRPNWPG